VEALALSVTITKDQSASGGRELTDEPVRLQWVGEPWLGPAVGYAAAHRLFVHALAPFVEEGELATRLYEPTAQPH